jgi:dihydropyrimidinase
LIIKNGLLVDSEGSIKADILIENGKIKEIGDITESESERDIIDAQNEIIIPGGVDVHTHMDLDIGSFRAVDDFYTGTSAAAFGGTTTIMDHVAFGPAGCSLGYQIENYHRLAAGKSVIDYSFHGVFQHVDEKILSEMENLIEGGITSFKIYMTYGFMMSDEDIIRILAKAKELGAVIAAHAENDGIIKYLREYYRKRGKKEALFHALSRPDTAEAEAISRMICLSGIAEFPQLYFVHVSTKRGLDEIINARKSGAKNIYCETCTQYLTLTDDCYRKDNGEGLKYIMAPPLRKKDDIEALWKGIESGDIDVIATDHCPFLLDDKMKGRDDFRNAPGGVPGVEERIEIVLTEGIKRGISINKLIDKLCTSPAKIYGLYPNKGTIKAGSDADLTIIKKQKRIISRENRHSRADYTAYEGYRTDFCVDKTLQRGTVLISGDKLLAEKGCGMFLKRGIERSK